MKAILFALALGLSFLFQTSSAHADLTIVQKSEGLASPGEIIIKVKGDRVRMEMSQQVTLIFNGKTGEMTSLMNDEKKAVRISADKMKAAAETIKKFSAQNESAEKTKFVATGRKEAVNGHDTEQYVYDGPDFKATYWIALNYPNGADILKQLQSIKSDAWSAANTNLPDYRDLPGIPLRTRMIAKSGGASGQGEISTTIVSIKTDSLNDSEFIVPKDFQELDMPAIFDTQRGKQAAPSATSTP